MSEDSARLARRLTVALAVVSTLHALSPLVLRGMHSGLGWDETVYVSQIDPHVPAGLFSAPRARGLTLLTAPASLISPSLALLRWWLAFLSGVGMSCAFLPWLRLRRSYVVPLAAALWSGLWVTTYYSFEAMPNQYVAYGALAATGWLLLALREPQRRRFLWYAAAALTFTALIRPSDCLFVFVPLVVAVLAHRPHSKQWRGWATAVLGLGVAAGLAEWVIEAFVRFGSPIARFHAASAENTGGLHWSLGAQMRVLAGPILCRGSCHVSAGLAYRLWWFALPILVAVGLWVARRQRRFGAYVVATAVGVSVALQYFIAIAYAAPRFLEPSYALLALPAAEGVARLWQRAVVMARPLAIAAAAAVVAFQAGTQYHLLHVADRHQDLDAAKAALMADYLSDTDVDRPCWVGGIEAGQIAFLAHCHVLLPDEPVAEQTHTANATAVVIEQTAQAPTRRVAHWPDHTITELSVVNGWTVWRLDPLSPAMPGEMTTRTA